MKVVVVPISIYVLICTALYFFQESIIFLPQKLDKNYSFEFSNPYQELFFKTADGTELNGLLFKADSSKGLIFYLHGNAGSLASWGNVAKTYTDLNYDLFISDYRGYGKSDGKISGEQQIFDDTQMLFDEMKKHYDESKIIVLGYSIGTGPAAKLASANHPRLLILQAPYYNLTDLMKKNFAIIPAFILKYKFSTNEYLRQCKMPIAIFHGDNDEVIYYGSSLKLKAEFKPKDTLITLPGQTHNGMTDNPDYIRAIEQLLK